MKNKFLLAQAIFVSQATLDCSAPISSVYSPVNVLLGTDLPVSFGIVIFVQHYNTKLNAL